MKATYIDYSDTGSFSKTLLAYIAKESELRAFYGNSPDMDGFRKQLALKKRFPAANRAVLVKELETQYQSLLPETLHPVSENIRLLREENTFTVTTGHQLNIFTGPLYFIFKIVSTIRLAKELQKEFPENNFVPVYWMATEDHDFEEINHTRVHGKKLVWDTNKSGATGRMSTDDMEAVVRQYVGMLGLSENSSKLASIVKRAYLSKLSLADATRLLVHQLFQEYGLVIIDADRPNLKRLFSPIIEQDIIHGRSFKTVESTSAALQASGYQTQVNAREINFFYLTDEFRERMVRTDEGQFAVLNQQKVFSEAELREEISAHPERFSPNVIMRPLYQEVILPNLAYIGGGAEIVYWLQLKACFEEYGTPFPILVPRNSAMIADDSIASKIFRLDLTFKSIFKPEHILKQEYVKRHTKHRLNLRDEWMEFNAIFAKIKLRTHKIDPSLGPSTEAVKARLKKAINNLEKKLIRADKRNHQEGLLQIERLKEKLFPGGGLQERSENFAQLYIKFGDELVEELFRHFDPLALRFTVLY